MITLERREHTGPLAPVDVRGAVTGLCAAVAWFPAAAAVGLVSFTTAAVMFCVAPLVALAVGRRSVRTPLLVVDPSLVVAVGFAVFFLAGLVTLGVGGEVRYTSVGGVDEPFVLLVLAELAAVATAVVVPGCGGPFAGRAPAPPRALTIRRMAVFAQLLVAGAVVGTVITVVLAGGVDAAITLLTAHDKQLLESVPSGGRSAWQLCATPGCVALSTLIFLPGLSERMRRLCAVELVGVVALGLVMYGSRLLLTLSLVGLAASYSCFTGRAIRWSTLALVGVLVTAVSLPVLATRTGTSSSSGDALADVVGYRVLDVSIASISIENELGPLVRDPRRAELALGSVVPLVGVRAADLNDTRLDSLVAQHIDGGNELRGTITGFPPSLPTAFVLTFGLPVAVLAGLVLGVLVAVAGRGLIRHQGRRRDVMSGFVYALGVAWLFNMFKDGDLPTNIAFYAKSTVLLALLYGAVAVVVRPGGVRRES